MAPKNKNESTDLYARGRYGNKLKSFDGLPSAMLSDCRMFAIRYRGKVGVQGPAVFDIQHENLAHAWSELIIKGWEEGRLYINECMDPSLVILQGELMLNHDDGWLFRGSRKSGIHMREAMKDCETWCGWPARELLRSVISPSSWDDLNLLIDEFPDAVIEIVVFDRAYGDLAYTGRNSIVWEVRDGF